jgi:hypothetical protein
MEDSKLMRQLRSATENEVATALTDSRVSLPLTTPYEALEFFNCLLDVISGQRDEDEAADLDRIPPGFGSTS